MTEENDADQAARRIPLASLRNDKLFLGDRTRRLRIVYCPMSQVAGSILDLSETKFWETSLPALIMYLEAMDFDFNPVEKALWINNVLEEAARVLEAGEEGAKRAALLDYMDRQRELGRPILRALNPKPIDGN